MALTVPLEQLSHLSSETGTSLRFRQQRLTHCARFIRPSDPIVERLRRLTRISSSFDRRCDPLLAEVCLFKDCLRCFSQKMGRRQEPCEMPDEPLLKEVDAKRCQARDPFGRSEYARTDKADLIE